MAPGSRGTIVHRQDDDGIRVELGKLSVALPPTTPPEALETIERLLAVIDGLADRTAQLHIALDSRVAIEQAKGILAERLGISPQEAFDVLRATARRRRTPLHGLADAIVAGRTELE
jgi:AmiR/NasT family two-component response regulator